MNGFLLFIISVVTAASSDTISISYDTSQVLTSVLGSTVQASESPIGPKGSSAIDAILRSLSALSETGDSSDVVSETADASEGSSNETAASETDTSEEESSSSSSSAESSEKSESSQAAATTTESKTNSSTSASNIGATLGCGSAISLLVLALL